MWKQVRSFNLAKMGHKIGYCLQNVRLGYGIPAKYASAKDDMLANKKAGTLHDMGTIPNNVTVPVYVDSSSQYEHIMVCDKGTYYSDGRKLTSVAGMKFFGWGEICDGVRVVEWVNEPAPTLKYKVGDKVEVGSYYASSTDPVSKAVIRRATGTITKVLTNGCHNPYLLDNGAIGWCNDGDIIQVLNASYYPACPQNYTSIVDALNSIGVNSSYANRKAIATKNGISNYTGTATQNNSLLVKLKAGRLIK